MVLPNWNMAYLSVGKDTFLNQNTMEYIFNVVIQKWYIKCTFAGKI